MIPLTATEIPASGAAEWRKTYRASEKGKAARQRERKTEGHRTRKNRYERKARRSRRFVAWDGEGVNRADGSHDYILLANSDGVNVSSMTRLRTVEIFTFIFAHHDRNAINVIYGAGYDWNCWLADLSEGHLKTLYDTGKVYWNGYRIMWRRGKEFSVARGGTVARFFDVISFFQTSFVNACDSYLGDLFVNRELVAANKLLRSTFRADDLKEIKRYNDAELVNLVMLMDEFRARILAADLFPTRWDGPGALAVALMRRENVKPHKGETPAAVMPSVRQAYFGGRFELVKFGAVKERAYEYDINSAYPSALTELPSLAGGEWRYDSAPSRTNIYPYALYRITWDGGNRSQLPQPFPQRHKDGTVNYPTRVTGTYWSPEIASALEYVEIHGGELTLESAWYFAPATDEKPFAFMPEMYERRRALKEAGNGAHVGYKLAYNSCYGKLAQAVGWRILPDGTLQIPPYHQLDWAGYITSKCRATVLRAAIPRLSDIIAFETDALFSSVPLELPISDALGEWDETVFESLTYLQSGTYFGTAVTKDGPKEIAKTRGVDKGTLTRDIVETAMRNGAESVPATLTRFVGLGIALRGRMEEWRRWITSPKNVHLSPNGKRIHVGCPACASGEYMGVWHTTIVAPRNDGEESAEFVVPWENPNEEMKILETLREQSYESETYDE